MKCNRFSKARETVFQVFMSLESFKRTEYKKQMTNKTVVQNHCSKDKAALSQCQSSFFLAN